MATIHLPPDFKEFLKLLNENQVEYLLIGGYAVGYYGYPRATADMDIWVAVGPDNSEKLVSVLKEFGFNVLNIFHNLIQHQEGKMIIRIWHGWTTHENANAYEELLKHEIFTGIRDREIAGYRGIQLLRRELGSEVEFITIMRFDSLEAVKAFAGDDYELAVVLPPARKLLDHFDARSQHYEVREEM